MGRELVLILQILFPIAAGCLLFVMNKKGNRNVQRMYVTAVLVAECALVLSGAFVKETVVEGFCLTPSIRLVLCNDGLSHIFGILVAFVWLCGTMLTK